MRSRLGPAFAALAMGLTLGACSAGQGPMTTANAGTPIAVASAPRRGHVTDMEAFNRFMATRPTPEQFRGAYPDVTLVLPGMPATMELRHDNSRYFVKLDAEGRIVEGHFG